MEGKLLLLVKLQAKVTLRKVRLHHGFFFTFFKLRKWYQIAQRTTFENNLR